jgi:hypothetical protein
MKATIYIPDDKAELYEQAKAKLKDSISETFVHCLENALENLKVSFGRIVVDVEDPDTGHLSKKAFQGAWLIGDETHGEAYLFDKDKTDAHAEGEYAVAHTKKGGIVVACFDRAGALKVLRTFANYKQFSAAESNDYPGFPKSLIAAVASELGEEHIEELDV